jgi:hypothetical protein
MKMRTRQFSQRLLLVVVVVVAVFRRLCEVESEISTNRTNRTRLVEPNAKVFHCRFTRFQKKIEILNEMDSHHDDDVMPGILRFRL